jgi:ribonuclease BN (tRNA processing enzyme)
VRIDIGDRVLVIDAGTGIRPLGNDLAGGDQEIYVLFTHLHDDHIQGFPFFKPLYEPDRTVHLLHHRPPNGTDAWSPLSLFDGTHFPLTTDQIPADCHHVRTDGLEFLRREGIAIERRPLNHPGGAYGYRLRHDGHSFAHLPDNELQPPNPHEAQSSFDDLAAFCNGVDLLCHDAQYRPDEMPVKWGWGHSLVSQACALAIKAEVDGLLLFHHDPARTDDEVDTLQTRARGRLAHTDIQCAAAYETLSLDLSAGDVQTLDERAGAAP